MTHWPASQTVAQMTRNGLLALEPSAGAGQPVEAELPAAFGEILLLTERAVVSRPMRA